LAEEKGIENGGWITVKSARNTIEARALVTRRLRPFQINGQRVHQIGIPFHWGYAGESVGDVANDLVALSAEPNVSIQEDKAFGVDVFPGRTFRSNQTPTEPYAPWPTIEPSPQTPPSAQPEGMIYKEPRQ
jgi:formate dehydrogenase major subunit